MQKVKSKLGKLILVGLTARTNEPGKMPDVVISAWQKIWAMKESDFGGKRKYISDFEIYDQRASNPNHAVIDIYIGIS